MNAKARYIFQGGLTLGISQVSIQAFNFLRSIVIARLVSPADFGIAAIFTLTATLLEMASNLAAETLIVQADCGDDTDFQSAAHLVQAGRGLANAVVIFVIAGPFSRMFGIPNTRWAFQCMALVPLVKGLGHTDLFRLQRFMKFGPGVSVNVWSTALSTLVALPLGWWLRSYAVMVWVIFAQALCWTIGSHLVAERPYRWKWNRSHFARVFSFGWPLLINGLLMYLILQGDRLVIAVSDWMFAHTAYTLADLGIYSLAFSLTMMPTTIVANVSTSLFLPVLAGLQGTRGEFERSYRASAQIVCLAALAVSVPFILAGGWLVVTIYGAKYASAVVVIGWLAAMQALRTVRVAPTIAAMALGDTRNALAANVVRTTAFVAVLLVAASGWSLKWFAACGFGGEVLALAAGLWWLRKWHGIPARLCLQPCAISLLGLALAAAGYSAGLSEAGWVISIPASVLVVAIASSAMLVAHPSLRQNLLSVAARRGIS